MNGIKWLFVGIFLDIVFECVKFVVVRRKRKRYFCIHASYMVFGKVEFGMICFSLNQFPMKIDIINEIEKQNKIHCVTSLRISNIYEFKTKKDYENFIR